jgi:hypothetical protein
MQKVRNRLVNFRVTEEEFEQLRSACDRQGARCLSHFVRNVMLGSPNLDPDDVITKVVTLDRRLAALETRFPSNSNEKEVPPCV